MEETSLYNYFRIIYYLAGLMRRARWSRDRLEDYQKRKVKEIVKHAYDHVPFYHDKFKRLGLKPDDIRSVKDLNKLPIVRRDELQKNADKLISDEFDKADLLVERTSGSTGQPLVVFLTRREEEFRKAKLLRANISCGQKPKDRWLVITSPINRSNIVRIQRWLGVFSPITVSVFEDVDSQISFVKHVKPDVLESYSSSLLLMSKEIEKKGIELTAPKLVIGGADLIGDRERRLTEKMLKAPFYDQYSTVEFDALAWQCEERDGYHIDADTVVMEFVDEDGERVAPGETGEIVCTSLFNHAMPFIRYAIGDVGTPSEEKECSCGRVLPLMKLVEGRKDSLITLPNGPLVSPAIITIMENFKFYNSIYRYRVIQKRRNLINIIIKMKTDVVDRVVVKNELITHFGKELKVDADEMAFEVEFVDDIPLDKGGKLASVVSEI